MGRIECKGGKVFVGGQEAGTEARAVIAVLQAYTGRNLIETCDLLNNLLQSFDVFMEKLRDLMEKLGEVLKDISQDICESGESRRTKHGSSIKAGKPIQAKANIKWSEKYRPP